MLTGVSVGRGGPRLFIGGPGFSIIPLLVLFGILALFLSGALPEVLFVMLFMVLAFVAIILVGVLVSTGMTRLTNKMNEKNGHYWRCPLCEVTLLGGRCPNDGTTRSEARLMQRRWPMEVK